MNERSWQPTARRGFLAGAATLCAATVLTPVPARAMSARYAQSLRLLGEGDARLDWVLSLLPLNVPPLPDGTVIKTRYEFPSPHPAYLGKDAMSVFIYALLPPPLPADPIPISAFHAAIEDVALDKALEGGTDFPINNLAMSGRVASIEVPSPFGDLSGRAFGFSCGFEWIAGGPDAAFKLLAGSVAGSHVTVLESALGQIEVKRPWRSY